MAILSGEVMSLNRLDPTVHAVGAAVIVRLDGATIGTGLVDDNDEFSIELPAGTRGELEIHLGVLNSAPTLAQFEDHDLHISILYSNVNNFFA